MQAVRKEDGVFIVDFEELSKQWLPRGVVEDIERRREEDRFSNPRLLTCWKRWKNFFDETGMLEWFESALEFLSMHSSKTFRRGEKEVFLLDHSVRTAEFAFSLTGSLPPEERAIVVLASLVHDFGKATVEGGEIKKHAEFSFEACVNMGMFNPEWDRVVREGNPLEIQAVRAGNAVCYLAKFHHEADIPRVDVFVADNIGLLKRLLSYVKRADGAAAKFESGEASSEGEAIAKVVISKKAAAIEKEGKEEEAVKVSRELSDRELAKFLSFLAKGINRSSDGRTPSKLYGYTVKTAPFVALITDRMEKLATSFLGIGRDELEEVLSRFAPEGKSRRKCVIRTHPTAPPSKEEFFVVDWSKVERFLEEQGEKLTTYKSLLRNPAKVYVSLVQG